MKVHVMVHENVKVKWVRPNKVKVKAKVNVKVKV